MVNAMIRGALAACVLGALGCAADADSSESARAEPAAQQVAATGSLLPLKAGNTWTYTVTDGAEIGTKTVTIGAVETVGGTGPSKALKASKSTTLKSSGAQTLSWQAEVDGRVVRYREQSIKKNGTVGDEVHWAQPNLRVDNSPAHTVAGATWTETNKETTLEKGESFTHDVTDTWTVEAVDVEVKVPAGTFRAIQFKKVSESGAIKKFWYARGVGKVKEEGGQVEELSTYKLAP